jgi:DNA (cytosine-5)-methyltransferase 1
LKKKKENMIMNKTQRPLRVFEAFAGIGAQATALKRIGVNFEVVGISDWFTDAIICYDAIHSDKTNTPSLPDKKEILSYLSQFQFSKDSVHPSRIESFDDD